MAPNKPASTRSKASKSSANASGSKSKSGGSGRSKSVASTRRSSSTSRSRNGSSRSSAAKSAQSRTTQKDNGVVGTVKQVASKAKGPAVAVGATAAGVAGVMLLRGRMRRKTVLGVPVPHSLDKASISEFDVKSMAKTLGKASKSFGETSKSVSRDIERVGRQAERIGKILG